MNTTWSDILFVHLTILLWVGPLVPGVVGVTAAITGSWQYTVGSTALYGAIKVLTDRFACLPESTQRALAVHVQRAFLSYFRIEHVTPSVMVRSRDWKQPQLIMTGPHGVFTMGGFVSSMTSDHLRKHVVCAIDPTLIRCCWFEPIVHMVGSMGVIPLRHAAICAEMRSATRDLMVIPGGFVETNTGNETYATMDDSKWDYWLLQCLRWGYDASFQWVHGETNVYHTGTVGMRTRLACARRGLPCVWPRGK